MPRAGLTTDRVVSEAELLADEVGLAQLSLAALAARLGVQPPSLYKHIAGQESLQQLLEVRAKTELAEVMRDAAVGRSDADAVRALAHAYRRWASAHPGRYSFTATEEFALFTEFIAHGGRGVEVVTGSHTSADYLKYADMAMELGLLASRGSDFHSPEESHTDLGALPDLQGRLTPVWSALQDRVQRA